MPRVTTWLCVLLAPVLGLASSGACDAGGTKSDYARAVSLARQVRGKVRNEKLNEVWLNEHSLVYRRTGADGTWRFVLARVLDEGADHRDAFDHAVVAKHLAALADKPLDPRRLPVHPFALIDGELRIRMGPHAFAISAKDDSVRVLDERALDGAVLEPGNASRSTEGGGGETELVFINDTKASAQLFWIDRAGKPVSYGEVAAGSTHRQHTFHGHVWQVRALEGRVLGTYAAPPTPGVVKISRKASPEPAATPARRQSDSENGRYRGFIRDHNVWVRDLRSGKESQLSKDGAEDNRYRPRWQWAQNRYLLVVQEVPAQRRRVMVVNSVPSKGFQPQERPYNYLKPGDRIAKPRPRLFDATKRVSIPIKGDLFDNPWAIKHISVAPDGKHFHFLYNQRGHQVLRLIEVAARTGKVRALIDESCATFFDYSQKTFLRPLEGHKAWLWMSERSGWNHLYRIDARTRKAHAVTEGEWVVRKVLSVDEAAESVRFEAMGVYPDQDPYHIHVGRVGLAGGDVTWLTEGDGTHAIRFSPDGAHYIDTYSRVDLAPVHELRRTADGSLVVELERADMSQLTRTPWAPTRRFHAKGRDGETDIWGVIHVPSTLDPAQRYPVIESIYAGPHGHFVPKSFFVWSQCKALAELGFIVVQIDGMGTNWRRKSFHDVCWKNLGDSGFADRMAWMRAAAAAFPFMDLERIGIYGGSAGGQSALRALLAHGDFYDAAVADCGCHDNRMDKIWWNEAWMGWPVGPHYAEQSNITQAKNLRGKLMLTVGEVDRNVDPASTMKVVAALIQADKDFELIVFPGKGHGAGSSAYGRRRRADFFVRNLLGVEPRTK